MRSNLSRWDAVDSSDSSEESTAVGTCWDIPIAAGNVVQAYNLIVCRIFLSRIEPFFTCLDSIWANYNNSPT